MHASWNSERSLRLAFEDDGGRALGIARAISAAHIGGVVSVRSTLGFVSVRVDDRELGRADAIERAVLHAADGVPPPGEAEAAREVVVPVCYDAAFAPDVEAVARECGLTPDNVVERHAGSRYRACFLGFSPGFAYLTGVPAGLAVHRLASPRRRVEGGSVAIANAFTGVYPRAMPGGWRIIGRTPMRMFDPDRPRPCAIEPGDRVRFDPITRREFDFWREPDHA